METPETGYSLEGHVEGRSRHLGAPLLHHDLAAEADELRRASAWQANGHSAKTLVRYPNLRVVLVALRAGARMGEHRAPGQLTIQTLSGRVQVEVAQRAIAAPAGELVAVEAPLPHDVEAVEDSVLLLTLWWPGRRRREPPK